MRRSPLAALAAVVVAAVAAAAPAGPAGANHLPSSNQTLSTSSCSWLWKARAGQPQLDVRLDPSNPFPEDRFDGGAMNSFHGRITDSISRYSSTLDLAYGDMSMRHVGYSPTVRDINLLYTAVTTFDPEVMGATRAKIRLISVLPLPPLPGVFPCIPGSQSPPSPLTDANFELVQVDIAMRHFPEWFTQDDSRRSYWETSCATGPLGDLYTCTKTHDFGSTLMHELGHSIGLVHPSEVPTNPALSVQEAHCTQPGQRATMCPTPIHYESARRTLDTYDLASVGWHQERH